MEVINKVKLCNIAELITKGTTPTTLGYSFQSTGVNFLKIECFDDNGSYIKEKVAHISEECNEKLKRSQLKCGDILFSIAGAIGRVAIVTEEMLPANTNQALAIIRISNEDVYMPYIELILNSPIIKKQIEKKKQGVAQLNLSLKDIGEFEIPLLEKEQQVEIVDLFSKVNYVICCRTQELQQFDDLVKARFVELFGDPILNPKGFPVYKMNDVVEFQGGSQPDKKYFEYEPTEDNIRLIQIRDYKTDKYITYIPKSMAKRFCTVDDIMIGRYGPPIFQILQGIEGSFNVALMKATPKIGNREFIRQFLKQDCLLEYLEGLSKRTAGQDGIQMDKLKEYPFPMPPIELQKDFEQFIKQIDKSKVVLQKVIDAVCTLLNKFINSITDEVRKFYEKSK